MEEAAKNVIVVGAGLAGLALSLGLAKLGYTVDLVEKRRTFTAQGATFGLRPNGIQALEELCGDAVVPPLRNVGLSLPMARGGLMLPWHVVRDSLLQQVEQRADKIRLRTGLNLQDLDNGIECVTVSFQTEQDDNDDDEKDYEKDGEKEGAFVPTVVTLKGCLLIGCDGVNSCVREYLGLPAACSSGTTLWRGSATVSCENSKLFPLLDQGLVPLGMVNQGPCTFMIFNFHPALPNVMAWTLASKTKDIVKGTHAWTVLDPHLQDEREREIIQEILESSLPEDVSHVMDLKTIDPTSAQQQQSRSSLPSGWGGKGRVTILGDAAHAMRPASGLGGSMAFEDCVVLCRELAVANNWRDFDRASALISRFETARVPRVSKIWKDEWERSESAYTGQRMPPATDEYMEWLHAGV